MSIDLTDDERAEVRGSQRLLSAWKHRDTGIDDELVAGVARLVDGTTATLADVRVSGGKQARGLGFTLTYADDDTPRCGNDLVELLRLLGKRPVAGGGPIIIIDGIPAVDVLRMHVAIGDVAVPQIGR